MQHLLQSALTASHRLRHAAARRRPQVPRSRPPARNWPPPGILPRPTSATAVSGQCTGTTSRRRRSRSPPWAFPHGGVRDHGLLVVPNTLGGACPGSIFCRMVRPALSWGPGVQSDPFVLPAELRGGFPGHFLPATSRRAFDPPYDCIQRRGDHLLDLPRGRAVAGRKG
jgi:hypothetical protein